MNGMNRRMSTRSVETSCWKGSRMLALIMLLAAGCVVLTSGNSAAEVINFQGRLLEPYNPGGTYIVAFRLWNRPLPGAPGEELIWARAYEVTLDNGYFNVLPGEPGYDGPVEISQTAITGGLTPKTNDLGKALMTNETFLGVAVLTDGTGEALDPGDVKEIYPRRQLLSAPYALYTDNANVFGTSEQEEPPEPIPSRYKHIMGRTGTTAYTTPEGPSVIIAEIRDFPVRTGALLRAAFNTQLLFDLDPFLSPVEYPPSRARVTMDILVGGRSLDKTRVEQVLPVRYTYLGMPEEDGRILPVHLNWVGRVDPALVGLEPDENAEETLVTIEIRLSMADALEHVDRHIEARQQFSTSSIFSTARFSCTLGLSHTPDVTIDSYTVPVQRGSALVWDPTIVWGLQLPDSYMMYVEMVNDYFQQPLPYGGYRYVTRWTFELLNAMGEAEIDPGSSVPARYNYTPVVVDDLVQSFDIDPSWALGSILECDVGVSFSDWWGTYKALKYPRSFFTDPVPIFPYSEILHAPSVIRFKLVENLDSVRVADVSKQRLFVEEILPERNALPLDVLTVSASQEPGTNTVVLSDETPYNSLEITGIQREWSFGDGSSVVTIGPEPYPGTRTVAHTYEPGVYYATLTVTTGTLNEAGTGFEGNASTSETTHRVVSRHEAFNVSMDCAVESFHASFWDYTDYPYTIQYIKRNWMLDDVFIPAEIEAWPGNPYAPFAEGSYAFFDRFPVGLAVATYFKDPITDEFVYDSWGTCTRLWSYGGFF